MAWSPRRAKDSTSRFRRFRSTAPRRSARSIEIFVDGVTGRGFAEGRSSLKLMVSKPESSFRPLQASSRDDHDLLCRNRRVIGMLERVHCGCEREDCAGGEGGERARGTDCLVRVAGVWGRTHWVGGWAAIAMAVRWAEGSG